MKHLIWPLIGSTLLLIWWGGSWPSRIEIRPNQAPIVVTTPALSPPIQIPSSTGEPTSHSTKIEAPILPTSDESAPHMAQTADLRLTINPHYPFAVRGERFAWDLEIINPENASAPNLTVRIQIPSEMIDIRIAHPSTNRIDNHAEPPDWACDYTAVAKLVVCRLPQIEGNTIRPIRFTGRLPQTLSATELALTASLESALPDPRWDNNLATAVIPLENIRSITPPGGFLFAHITQPELGRETATDYKSEQWMTALLQAPFQIGIGYQEEQRPYLCLTQMCPESDRHYGRVMQESYAIQSIQKLIQTSQQTSPIYVSHDALSEIPLHRYAAAHPTQCPQSPCLGYGWSHAPHFAWQPEEMITIYTFTEGGRAVICDPNCLEIPSAEPGYYAIQTAVTLWVTFPDYPHISQKHTLEGVFHLKIVAPFLNSQKNSGGQHE